MTREFRFVYFTPRYEETVAFMRDALELPVTDSWDRPGDHRGTVFAVASGLLEVLENEALSRGPSHTGAPQLSVRWRSLRRLASP